MTLTSCRRHTCSVPVMCTDEPFSPILLIVDAFTSEHSVASSPTSLHNNGKVERRRTIKSAFFDPAGLRFASLSFASTFCFLHLMAITFET